MTSDDSASPKHGAREVSERAAQDSLRELLRAQGADQSYVESQVQQLFEDGGFRSRFEYFMEFFDDASKQHLLVSGAAVGTEMSLAVEYGFRQVTGTEVIPGFVDICNKRFTGSPNLQSVYYEGGQLPFADETFSSVVSGHIIEHTRAPFLYLREHMRVLQAGGYMFLEFPHRYHWIELHSGLPSLEWLPVFLRNAIIVVLVSGVMPLGDRKKRRYRDILETLKPVSVWQVSWWLRRSLARARIVHRTTPVPGITRLIIHKFNK